MKHILNFMTELFWLHVIFVIFACFYGLLIWLDNYVDVMNILGGIVGIIVVLVIPLIIAGVLGGYFDE